MDKGQFLQDIHMQFLKCVDDPAALMDEFRSQGAITSDEEGQIMAKTTRRDKVRRLWSFLKSDHVSSETFFKQCYPAIKARYPHILEGKKFAWDPGEEATVPCVRHAIMKRIPLKRFADLFPSAHGCSDEEYRLVLNHVISFLEVLNSNVSFWVHSFCINNDLSIVFFGVCMSHSVAEKMWQDLRKEEYIVLPLPLTSTIKILLCNTVTV